MTYMKPEVHEIGTAVEMIQGSIGIGSDNDQTLPFALALEDFEK